MNWTAMQNERMALEAAGVPAALVSNLSEARQALGNIEDSLRRKASSLADRVQRILIHLDEGLHLNELGEIQGSAVDVDILCARRQDAITAVKRAIWTINQVCDGLEVPFDLS